MIFKPTLAQLETIAEMANARATTTQIAAAIGISKAEFSAWAGRLVATRAAGMAVSPPRPTNALDLATVTTPRIVAERLFEGDSATDGMPHRPRMQFTVQR